MKSSALFLALGLFAFGCAHGRISDKVNETDFAKLSSDQTKRVQFAREELGRAQDEVTRAKVKLAEAKHEQELGDADRKVAEAVQVKAKAENSATEQARDAKMMEKAKQVAAEAEARDRVADAHHEFADILIEAREAAVEAADLKLELANAKVELAKLESLEESNPAAMSQYDASAFYERVAEKHRAFEKAHAKALKLDEEAKARQEHLDDLVKKVPTAM